MGDFVWVTGRLIIVHKWPINDAPFLCMGNFSYPDGHSVLPSPLFLVLQDVFISFLPWAFIVVRQRFPLAALKDTDDATPSFCLTTTLSIMHADLLIYGTLPTGSWRTQTQPQFVWSVVHSVPPIIDKSGNCNNFLHFISQTIFPSTLTLSSCLFVWGSLLASI